MVKYCTHCGASNADEARFCQTCGRGFAAASVEQATPRGTSAGRIAAIGCGVLLALVALAPVALVVVFALFLRQSARS